jgi:hypothetical protein
MSFDMQIHRIQLPEGIQFDSMIPKKLSRIASFLADEMSSNGTIGMIGNIVKDIFTLIGNVAILTLSRGTITQTNLINNSFKFLGVFNGIKTLIKNDDEIKKDTQTFTKKDTILKVASGTLGITIAAVGGFQILDTLKVIDLASVAISMGTFSITGSNLLLSFGSILSLFGIMKAGITLGVSAYKLRKINLKISDIEQKKMLWGSPILTEERATYHIKQIRHHQAKTEIEANQIAKLIKKNSKKFKKYKTAYSQKEHLLKLKKIKLQNKNVILQTIGKISSKIALIKAKRKLHQMAKIYYARCDRFDGKKEAYQILKQKEERWKRIRTIIKAPSEVQSQALTTFSNQKLAKWEIKRANLNLDKLKTGLKIGVNIILIIALIASIVLTATGVGAIPVLIGTASLFLFVSLSSMGLRWFKKCKKPAKHQPVPVPEL